ncbi:MAG: HEAT repeat domain-containing protein [Nitrospira sp.]|nr:HEAT repeat domain-containing protein [Nitrospira sp.]
MLELWYVTALSIACMILLLLVGILLFRMSRHAKQRRRQRVTALWQPLLERCHEASLDGLPSLTPPEHIAFLYLWNEQNEATSGATTAQLNRMARHVGSDRVAKSLLRSRLLRRRILALVTLGRLRDQSAWQEISALLIHSNSFLAFQAAQALLLIDATAAIPLLVPLIGRRTDWSPLKIASMLSTAGPDLASEAIVQAARQGDPVVASRLIRHLPTTRSARGLPALRQFLQERPPADDMLAACLFAFGEFREQTDLQIIRDHLSHPAWYVRVQAAAALGKVGTQDDEARLIALFNDEQWWVRYRAGEALASLPSMTEDKLERMQETLPTPEAQEILAPVLAKFRARQAQRSIHGAAERTALAPTSQ